MYEHKRIVIVEVLIVLISVLRYVASYSHSRGTQHDSCNVTISQNNIIITT